MCVAGQGGTRQPYVGLILTLYFQAQRGQSVVDPDALTAVIAVALIGLPAAIALALAL